MANEKFMPWTMVINVFVIVVLAANFEEKNILPFPLISSQIIRHDPMISNGAANTSFLLTTHQSNTTIVPLYWWNRVSSTNSIGASARKEMAKC